MNNESKTVKSSLQKETIEENKKLLTLREISQYFFITNVRYFKKINPRKNLCSKHSGKVIAFLKDAIWFAENTQIDEENEPP